MSGKFPSPAYLRGAFSLLRENRHHKNKYNTNKTSNEGGTSCSTLCGDRGHAVGQAHLCERALDQRVPLLLRRWLSLLTPAPPLGARSLHRLS